MKKILVLILTAMLFSYFGNAQSPNAFNYQAVVRDGAGNLIAGQSVLFRISILPGATGTPAYVETHNATTDQFGLANLKIGGGTVSLGNFANLRWDLFTYFVKVELDPSGGTNFTVLANKELLSVPYALHSRTSDLQNVDKDTTNELQTISKTGNIISLTKSSGTVDLTSYLDNTDNQTLTISGNTLSIIRGNSVSLNSFVDGDSISTNELQNLSNTVSGSNVTVTISNGTGTTFSINDADASATNELQTITKTGNTVTLSNSGGSFTVDDADASATNEIQIISKSGNTVSLSNGGGSIDLTSYLDNTDNQTLSIAGTTLSITGGNSVSIPAGTTVPPGTIVAFGGTSIPTGWLLCDGSPVSRTTFSSLFSAIAISWGPGDGINTFNIPDLRAMFLRGVNGTRADQFADPDAASRTGGNNVGSKQDDAFQGHTHQQFYSSDYVRSGGSSGMGNGGNTVLSTSNDGIRNAITDGTNGTPKTSSETRPKNAYVNYIIKH